VIARLDLSTLNPAQREAVITTEGPLLVLAGAGSGKTRVITHRIAWLLGKKKVPAEAILALTFTNKAAGEMRERAVKLAGTKAKAVTLCTFHAFGAEMMRQHAQKLGYPRKFAIADMGDQISIIRRAMKERNVDDRAFDARKVLSLISKARNEGVIPEPKPEGMGDDYDLVTSIVYPLYLRALKAQGSMDFDDLIVLPRKLLEEHPRIRSEYQSRFQYVMVDEYQDTNKAQLQLLSLLVGAAKNVCVVGDDDQCIYSWRGAEVRNILDFEKGFPGGKTVKLEHNYRSTQVILDSANAVIAKNPERRDKRMFTDALGGKPLSVVIAPDENEEARYVAFEIKKAIGQGLPPSDIAVLYRTNGQSRPIEEALREQQVYYEVIGGQEFFDQREVKDVIAYLKLITNSADEVSLMRIVNVPSRGIGDVTMERLQEHAHAKGQGMWQTLQEAKSIEGLPRGAAEQIEAFVNLLGRYRARFQRGNLAEVARAMLEEMNFSDHTRSQSQSLTAQDRRLRGLSQVLDSLASYEKSDPANADLRRYLNRLSLDTREEEEAPDGRKVTLMTLHGAKGLEWRLVFLIGMEEDLLPHGGMQGEPPNLEEERRLCYVGITRAREKLVLTRAAQRIKRGKPVERTPSRYLEDIPKELTEVVDLVGGPAAPPDEKEKNFFASLKEKLKAQGQQPKA
jgi:DNA helicase II / ATP-dependent DNA helicase PcrA